MAHHYQDLRMAQDVVDKLKKDVMAIGEDIVKSDRFAKAKKVVHHNKERNIANHCMETAEYALWISRWLNEHGISVSEEDAVRASLLHDIGMTEDEVFLSPSHQKAYTHPVEGSRIARQEFGANRTQTNAILRHMWPIGFIPPKSTEGWVVVAADKFCSINEVYRFARRLVAKGRPL